MTLADVAVVPDWAAVAAPALPRELAETIFSRAGAFVMEGTDAEACVNALMERTAKAGPGDPLIATLSPLP